MKYDHEGSRTLTPCGHHTLKMVRVPISPRGRKKKVKRAVSRLTSSEPYQNQTGLLGATLIYKSDGIFNTQEELDAYTHANGTQPGDIIVLDLSEVEVIDSKHQQLRKLRYWLKRINIPGWGI